MSNFLKEVGVVIGESSSTEFLFSSRPDEMPSRWEYILIYSREDVDGNQVQVEVVAQIERIISMSQALTKELDYAIIEKIIEAGLADRRVWGKARVLGYLTEDGDLRQPKKAIMPGQPVYIAPAELLQRFYSYPEEEALTIGSLVTRSEVPISLSLKGFRRHLAIIAQTGAGKTYLAGVIVEELLRKGGTIVMLDPHADYVFLSRTSDGKRYDLSDRVTVFRNPSSTGRYTNSEVGKVESYEICFSDLSLDEICLISGINPSYTNIKSGLEVAFLQLKAEKNVFQPEDLLKKIEDADGWKTLLGTDSKVINGAKDAAKYLAQLVKMHVFTDASTNVVKMLQPRHLSIVDLSGLSDHVSDYLAYRILSDIYENVLSGKFEYPVFIFVEEAHRFVPAEGSTYSDTLIKKIAGEGRKFGVFLILITQRPFKIHSDVLSQCNSQIIMRITNPQDQNAVASSSERLSQTLLEDLPGLNKGEAVIIGEMTRAPIVARVRKRTTKEGGSDIDILGKLRAAIEKTKEDDASTASQRLRDDLKSFLGQDEEEKS